jgi:sulfatase modifying factor 1
VLLVLVAASMGLAIGWLRNKNKVPIATASPPSASTRPAPCPRDMALFGASCIDRYEASLVERLANGREGPFSPYSAPDGHDVRAVSLASTVPQGYVSLVQARRACAASGKRVCRVDEWTNACKGPSATRYPYGDKHVPGACNDSGRAPLAKFYSGTEMYEKNAMNDPRLNQQAETVSKTGEAKGCTNTYGVYDMVGNLHEWLDDGAFHGGYYLDVTANREGCDYATVAHEEDYRDYSIGFRCCKDRLPSNGAP